MAFPTGLSRTNSFKQETVPEFRKNQSIQLQGSNENSGTCRSQTVEACNHHVPTGSILEDYEKAPSSSFEAERHQNKQEN